TRARARRWNSCQTPGSGCRAIDHPRRIDDMDIRIQALAVDATDPDALATFWEAALGWRRTYDTADEVVLEPPAGSKEDGVSPDIVILRVPEAKSVKNRLHLDLRPKD